MRPAVTAGRRAFVRGTAALAAGALLMPPGSARAGTSRRAMRDYLAEDATGLARRVRRREVSPAELLDLAIARTDAVNGTINAVCARHDGLAREGLRRIDARAPLAGVPFLLKDEGVQLEGTATSDGSRFFAGRIATATSTVVRRYQAAGLGIFGKTTTPEFGQLPGTVSTLWGVTRNPWNPAYSPGGSSGGSSAAVAAGIVPVAHAVDGGGSIRFPAAMCGLVGLKPTRGRTPHGPGRSEGWAGLSCGHVVSRSLRDSALLLDIAQGPEPGAASSPPPPPRPFIDELGRDPGRLRIAVIRRSPADFPVHQDNLDAIDRAVAMCRTLGHELQEVELPASFGRMMESFGLLGVVGVCAHIAERVRELGREPAADELEVVTAATYGFGQTLKAVDYELARQAVQRFGFEMQAFMEGVDVLLTPLAPRAPWLAEDVTLAMGLEDFYNKAIGYSDFTAISNVTGQPAITLPLHWNAAGIPVGTHFAARYGDEATLLQLAAQLEQAAPWTARVSPMLAEGLRA